MRKGVIYIQAWASALLVLTDWAMRRPLYVGRVTGTNSHVFFVCVPKREIIMIAFGEIGGCKRYGIKQCLAIE